MKKFIRGFIFFTLIFPALAFATSKADNGADTSEADIEAMLAKLDTFKYQQSGRVSIGDVAVLEIPAGFKYLDGPQAASLLHDVWKNPYAPSLGMLMPADKSPFLSGCWVVEITYEEDGHVKDDDAKDIKYDDLLKQMQKGILESNDERVKQGGKPIELVGWAEPPSYDASSHKLYWAKKLREINDTVDFLNYNIRILGRKGVLVLNGMGSMDKLQVIKYNTPTILAATNFTSGNQYADFNSSIDKVAAYGIVGLIAGGVLAKTGLLAKVGILLLKFLKPLLVALGGGIAAIGRFFTGKKKDENQA